MGLIDWFKGIKKSEKKSELKKSFEKSERTLTIQKSEDLNPPPEIYSPTVEHPLLTIQDRISKLEEIYRSMNEKIDKKLATKEDSESIRLLVGQNLDKSEQIMGNLDNLDKKLVLLEGTKGELTRKIDTSTYELTQDLGKLQQVERSIKLLEADKRILEALGRDELSTIELSAKVGYTRQYLWGRLKQMQDDGLVTSFKTGRQTKYTKVKGKEASVDATSDNSLDVLDYMSHDM